MATANLDIDAPRTCAHRPCSYLVDPAAQQNAIYCSRRCKENARRSRKRREQSSIRVRDITPRICCKCGAAIPDERGNRAIYCSLACRHIAKTQRHRSPKPSVAELIEQVTALRSDITKMATLVVDTAAKAGQSLPPDIRDWILTYLPDNTSTPS